MAVASLLKYEGSNNVFVWKHPCEDFNSLTQLIVHESQEAVFFLNGQALDLFGPGRYTLETENIPKTGGLLNLLSGTKSPFHCEVYFINKAVQMSLKWGTDSRIRFIEPETGVPLEIGAGGSMNLAVFDSRKLLVKLVGTMKGISWENPDQGKSIFSNGTCFTQSLQSSFRNMINMELKTNLCNEIKRNNIDILEIDAHLKTLSEVMKKNINISFEQYGLLVHEFYIDRIVLPEQDINFRKIRDLRTVLLQKKIIGSQEEICTAQAEMEAHVIAAKRQVEIEKQTTATEVEKMAAQRRIIEADGKAYAYRSMGLAEADVMRSKGYSEKDILNAEVQKAYAEGIGKMGVSSGNNSNTVTSDVVGMMAGIKMAGVVLNQMNNVLKDSPDTEIQNESVIKCQKCGYSLPASSKFCLNCGARTESEKMIVCPGCGNEVKPGKFCMKCGRKLVSVCPKCGTSVTEGSKFCNECGYTLGKVCKRCNAENSGEAKYCDKCGEMLD